MVVRAPAGAIILFFPERPCRLWGPPSLLINVYRRPFYQDRICRSKKLTIYCPSSAKVTNKWICTSTLRVLHFARRNLKNWSENWTVTASQRRGIEAADMKLLRPLAGYTLYELQVTGTLDKIGEYRRNWFQHLQRTPQNRIPLKSYYYRHTRKENNWKTEEALERAVVTLETKRIKGSNS